MIATRMIAPITALVTWGNGLLARIPASLVQLFVRIVIARVFWASGQTKVDGFEIRPSAFQLFEYEYQVPLLPPEIATVVTTVAEHLFPLLLVIGLATRFSALALLVMTLVIQFFVYPDAWWPVHSLWVGLLIAIMAYGPGAVSLDHLIARQVRARAA